MASLIRTFNEQGATTAQANQAMLDQWTLAATAAFRARRFLMWCDHIGINRALVPPPYARAGVGSGGAVTPGNEGALRRAMSPGSEMSSRMRLAVLLNVVYAIRVHRIAALRRDTLRIVDGQPVIRLGSIDLELPLDSLEWLESIAGGVTMRRRFGGSDQDGGWVFPGYRHGQHMVPSSLAAKLRALGVTPMNAHQASTAAIVSQVPPAVVSRLLGVSVRTATKWHEAAGNQVEQR